MFIKFAYLILIFKLIVFTNQVMQADEIHTNPNTVININYANLDHLILNQNEIYLSSIKETESQSKKTGILFRSFLPEISLQAGREKYKAGNTSYEEKNFWSAEASLNLFNGGKDLLENQIRESNVEVTKLRQSIVYQTELKEAKINFWKSVALIKKIKLINEALNKNKDNIRSAKTRFNAGVTTSADIIQFELQGTSLERQVKELELDLDLAKNNLSVALSLDDHKNIVIEDDFLPIQNNLVIVNPELIDSKIQQKEQSISQLKLKQTKRWWFPTIDIYARYGIPSLSDDIGHALAQEQEVSTGVKLTLNLGKSFEGSTESAYKKIEIESENLKFNHKKREQIANLHEIEHDLKVMASIATYIDQDIKQSEKLFNLTKSEYNRGVKNGPDLLAAFEKLYETRKNKINFNEKYSKTTAELDFFLAREK